MYHIPNMIRKKNTFMYFSTLREAGCKFFSKNLHLPVKK